MDKIKAYIERGREIEAKAKEPVGEYNDAELAFEDRAVAHHARLLYALEVAVNTIEAEQKRTGGTVPLLKSGLTRIAAILEGKS